MQLTKIFEEILQLNLDYFDVNLEKRRKTKERILITPRKSLPENIIEKIINITKEHKGKTRLLSYGVIEITI